MSSSGAPYFSVVIPLYNKAPHVARAIRSVLSQTLTDFELIIIDDASTDKSAEEAQKFNDPRIRLLYRSEPGPGGYAARNVGIAEAKAEWVAFLDADDEWYPEHLEKMHRLSREFPDVNLMGCGWRTFDGTSSGLDRYYAKNNHLGNYIIDAKSYFKSCLNAKRPVHTSFACVRVSSPVAPGLFPVEKGAQRGGDLHAWIKLISFHKQLAWSSHLGGVYFRDAANMVTKKAPSSPRLMGKDIYKELSVKLDHEETILLKKYLNLQLKEAWIGNIKRGNDNFFLSSKLYWDGGFFYLLFLVTLGLIPNGLVKFLFEVKKNINCIFVGD